MADNIFTFYSDKLNYKAIEDENGKKFYVEGYISTHDVDLVNDIVTESGMEDMARQLKDRNVKIDYEHEAFRGETERDAQLNKTTIPLGRIVGFSKDANGIKVKAELNENWKKIDDKGSITRSFSEIWSSIKGGFLDAFSIAYVPIKTAMKKLDDGTTARLLDNINLLNVALTGNPVNPGASMTAVMTKSLDFLKNSEGEENMKKEEIKDEVPEEAKEVQEAPVEEPVKEEAPVEEAPVLTSGAEPVAEPEQKSNSDLIEVKAQIKELQKENEELKALINKAQMKSVGAEPNKVQNEVKGMGPLDLIN